MEKKAKILLIDDDHDFVESTKTILESKPYEVIVAYEGDEGLRKAREEGPDLILLDIIMPVKDGFEFRKEQMQDPGVASIPVIVMTADGNIESKTEKIGGSGFLRKPFDLDEAIATIRQHALRCG